MAAKGVKASPAKRTTRPRKAAPAKAATRADGEATGEAPATVEVASPSPEDQIAAAETNGHSEDKTPEPPDKAELNGYPRGTPLYIYQAPDGEIVFPHVATVQVDPVFFYDIYSLPEMYQSFEWMNRAGVPHATGRRVMALPIGTRRELFGGWFQGMKERAPDENMQGGVPGES
jgi:hypothetical protein